MSGQVQQARKAIAEVYWGLRGTRDGRYGAYRLAFPLRLSSVHVVFHVSMLRKYTPDPTHVVDWGEPIVDVDETFEEGVVSIMDS